MPKRGAFRIHFELKGIDTLLELTRGMDLQDQLVTLETVLEEASKPIITTARQNITKEGLIRTGALRKSLGVAIRTYRSSMRLAAYIGARHIAYAGSVADRTAFPIKSVGPLQGSEIKVVPSKYIHLVHNGFRHVISGKRIKGKPFLKDAFNAHRKKTEWVLLNGASQALEKVFARNAARVNRSSHKRVA